MRSPIHTYNILYISGLFSPNIQYFTLELPIQTQYYAGAPISDIYKRCIFLKSIIWALNQEEECIFNRAGRHKQN